ncbi:helix-turn-helix domain-containing protein [Phytohabitans kaempferiae]|uniref:Helix-turn-helix domain-containing protein n=1 Tax=Phytohabitans kaempferiae TaxID=1620943 RepID=A0ABV6M3I5_9ACTN
MPTERKQFVQTVRSQVLGDRMRQLREDRGLTLKYIAAYLGVEFSTLARYERAEWPFRRDHVIALLDVYGVYDDAARVHLVELAQEAWRVNLWQPTDHQQPDPSGGEVVIDDWWVQQRAVELCVYANLTIPEVVQTRDYTEAVLARSVQQPMLVDKLVRRQIDKQQTLEDKKPATRLDILIEEPVLYRPVGGQAVLSQQLQHLTRLTQLRPHIKVRIVPTRVGWHAGIDGAFTLCEMQRPYPPVALVHHLDGRLILEAAAAKRYRDAFDKLREVALSPTESSALIATLADPTPVTSNSDTRAA